MVVPRPTRLREYSGRFLTAEEQILPTREPSPTGRTNGPTYHIGFRPIVYDNLLGQFLPTRARERSASRTTYVSDHITPTLYHSSIDMNYREYFQVAGPFGEAPARHNIYQAVYTLFNEADGDRLLPLLLDIFNAQAIGGLGIF
eukprot:jgi/Psemu1/29798/gm1.29798_g